MGSELCKLCYKRNKNNLQVGSVLDRVISQASNQDQCLLYKLANYKKGGELIDAYNIGGQIEVEKLIREQFGILMYGGGKGQIINRAEYLRWKFRDHEQVVLPIEASLSPHDPLAKWQDHDACWQMQFRGSLGETLLHVLIICDTKVHTKLARTLIKCFPKLAVDAVEGEEYLGASSLHLAIAYNNNELAQDLIDAGANVNQRAIGSFFLPRDQQRPHPAKHTDYEGLAYLGEYPLAWAACCANESVYNLLLDSGAHPDLKDNFGNMILHMVVVCDKLDMFGYALRHPKLPASNGIVNNSGLTPLTLACKLGRAEVFREMLELSAKEFWRYSNITCSAYPLNALDTLLPDGRTNWNSALFIILNGTKEEHLDMLDGGIIQRLLEEKWKTFARNQFLKRLLILFIHLLFMSLAVYLRPTQPDESLSQASSDITTIARYACEIGTVGGVLFYIVIQQGDEIKNQGLVTFMKQQSRAPAKAIFLISNLLILACIPCRLVNDQRAEEAILVFAVPGSWFLLMFFAGAVRLTGPFVTMIYSMITGDMLTFGIIYTIVLFGFSQSFYFLYKGYPNVSSTLYDSYTSTWMALFQITLGDYNYSELSMTTYPILSKTVFALFMVFVPILLLNMLIAMMGNTYAHVIEQSEKEWMKQWAKIVVTLERAVAQNDAHHYLQEYSISLGKTNDDPTMEQRGVMVIKSKSKTRAKQRKGAVANWKRVGKVTINELRKRGMTGEELRCLMWGRESINTPVKVKKSPSDILNPDLTNVPNNCFGDALTSALDVMTFTYDVDPKTGNTQCPNINTPLEQQQQLQQSNKNVGTFTPLANNNTNAPLQQQPEQQQLQQLNKNVGTFKPLANNNLDADKSTTATTLTNTQDKPPPKQETSANQTGAAMFNALTQLTDSQSTIAKTTNAALVTTTITIQQELVVNKTIDENFHDPMRELVLKSFNPNRNGMMNEFEILAKQSANIENCETITPKSEMSVTNLAGIFSGTDFIKKVEMPIKNKQPLIDASDSDSMEQSILGRLSRTRRAISANLRNVSARSAKRLLNHSDSNSSIDSNIHITYEQIKADDELDYASERMHMIKQSLKETLVNPTAEDTLKPVYVITSPTSTSRNEQAAKCSSTDEDIPRNFKSHKRSKTAKTNRVSPAVDVAKRRTKTAEKDKVEKLPESPPNPLQPWSVQGISNMNTILAWENDINSE